MSPWRHLPASARAVAVTAVEAVSAARDREVDAFTAAVGDLAGLDAAQTGLVLGTVVRLLMEDQHPDGLDGDDVRTVLDSAVRAAATWQPDVDPHVMLIVLAGALGVHDPDEQAAAPKPDVIARHAILLVTDLLARRPFADYLTRAFHDIERTQLND